MRSWAEFCGLPVISDEGHVVNTPLMFKRVRFGGEEGRRTRKKEEETEKEKKKSRERERSRPWIEKRA
ncbi:hypothetical protein TNCV_2834981 [Trichonephila clavipes]|nr:hypothetical protein TNCV_2834981 [Trichonephila clavipes]